MKNHVAIAAGLVAGLLFGLAAAVTGSPALTSLAVAIGPVGTLFVSLIRMVVIPLVISTLVSGVASLGDYRKLGKLGGITLAFYWGTTLVSIAVGMILMKLATPLVSEGAAASAGRQATAAPDAPGFVQFILSLVPSNPFAAAAEGALPPLILFALLFGAATGSLPAKQRDQIVGLADAVTGALITIVHGILRLAPFGVFALSAGVVATAGWGMLRSLGLFAAVVILGLILFVATVYLPLVKALGGIGPATFLHACLSPLAIAFSTTNSVAAIPAMMDTALALRVPRAAASLAIPVGASLNRAGSALFQGAAVVFLAALYGVPLEWPALAGAIFGIFAVSLSVPAAPSGSVMTLGPALESARVPLDGMGLLLGIDRIPDMFRTATNVTGDVAAAVIVGKIGGQADGRTGGQKMDASATVRDA